ncbi:MAG: SDR family oxidoreductase [Hamadaea sp.]|nr:SDR family oxidoreductase [Hamadaea sp.]
MALQPGAAQSKISRQPGQPVAIIGMAGRFPGATSVEEFRRNLLSGVESISFFDEDELRANGATEAQLADPAYVRAAPVLGDVDKFDAELFGLSAREAQLLDPQFRVFLEVCHAALENGGVVPGQTEDRVGVYAGSKDNAYLADNVFENGAVMRGTGSLMAMINNHTDYLATSVAFRLGLTGPAISMVTACSTSLVAIHTAVQALRAGECEVALAGGVEIGLPEVAGYRYAEGGIYSPDGRIRPFDAHARGTVFGNGVGVVLLKPLAAALADRNPIHAVIRGSAVNNDGNDKNGFFAPSKHGQAAVVRSALNDANVDPATIGYVEAHGTGTLVGDPIEVGALSTAYRERTDRTGYCAIASVKANIGHLGAAAGVAGMINAVCSVRDGLLAPVTNFDEPNPRIDFGRSPFYINREVAAWESNGTPRRAAISSFGIGGTNANVIIEQAPQRPAARPARRPVQLVALSAQADAALDSLTTSLAEHLDAGATGLADACYTLTVGRKPLALRRYAVVPDGSTVGERLTADLPTFHPKAGRTATFLFPGQGAQYPAMAAELYHTEPVFRSELNACAAVVRESHGLDLLHLIFHADAETQNQTCHTQPILFAVEYALAKTLQGMGVTPTAMAGHSVGEYVAAALAGVFSRDDAMRLVAERGALMQTVDSGAMLAVTLSEELLTPMLDESLDIAAVNAPGVCVVAGTHDDIARFEEELTLQGVGSRPLHTSHAFHSKMMDGILDRFAEAVRRTALNPPAVPFVSNSTGTWIADDEATDPMYWVRHLRGRVRFSETLRLLTSDGDRAFLEVGPGRTLTGYVTGHDRTAIAVPTMRHPKQQQSDAETLMNALGRVWAEGVAIDWPRFWGDEQRDLVPLPAYPYQRQRYWIDPDPEDEAGVSGVAAGLPMQVGAYTAPVWLESVPPAAGPASGVWITLARPGDAVLPRLAELAGAAGAKVIVAATEAEMIAAISARDVREQEKVTLVHGLCLGARPAGTTEAEHAGAWLRDGFHSGLTILQEAARQLPGTPVEIVFVSSQMQDVTGDGLIEPAKAALLGLVKLAPKELESISCRSIDFGADLAVERVAGQLLADISSGCADQQIAYRGRKRWTWAYASTPLKAPEGVPAMLRRGGVYLLTGGLGGLGLVLARQLAASVRAKLVLLSRTGLPDRESWAEILSATPDSPQARRIRSIREIEAAGGQVMTPAADVTDAAAMRAVNEAVQAEFGAVDGVFHLAAVAGGGMLETRSHEDAAAVLAPKVQGTYLLEEIFAPRLMVLYSSIAVLSADFGLGDYVGANSVLDAFAQSRWARGQHTVSVNWPPFAEVGMASEVLAPSVFDKIAHGGLPEDAPTTAVRHPMLQGRSDVDATTTHFGINLSHSLWVLAEHKLNGVPTMPGTGIIELIRGAYAELTGSENAEICDLTLVQPLVAHPGLRCHLELRRTDDGCFDAAIRAQDGNEYAKGRVGPPEAPKPVAHDLSLLQSASRDVEVPDAEDWDGPLAFGPRWTGITTVRSADAMEVVTVELGDRFRADEESYYLHPAVLDCAIGLGQILRGDGHYLPFSYGRITMHAPLAGRVHGIIRHLDDTRGEVSSTNVSVVDDDGNELAAIERFMLFRMPEHLLAAARSEPGLSDALDEVLPQQGEEALRVILGSGAGPQVIWCPEGLDVRLRRTAKVNREAVTEQLTAQSGMVGAPRTLTTPYVAPDGDVERILVELWSDTVGVERIGVEDDFFDLGGNSLFAVQLVARISHRFSVEVSAALLFDSRNVRTLAGAIEAALIEKISALSEDEARQALEALGTGAHVG